MTVPTNLRYTAEHEWVSTDGNIVEVGITEYAANALGDIVFVGLPRVGETLSAGQICGEIESTKSVSDLHNPVEGEVVEINEALSDGYGVINSDPYGGGWLFRMRVDNPIQLLDAEAYAVVIEEKQS
jgi:glycine cleavage system H protein